jgi:hypothetical protein
MGMADDIQLMQMLRNYQLPPQMPAGYQPLQMPQMQPPPQPQPMFPNLSLEMNAEGRRPQDVTRQFRTFDPYWLQYNRQF